MLYLTLKHSDGERELQLSAETLPDMIEKMKSWNDWDDFMSMFPQTRRYQRDPEGQTKAERESGWYWFKENTEPSDRNDSDR